MNGGVEVIHVTEDDLRATINDVLAVYPWMSAYPVRCHLRCARREIDEEYGPDAAKAWGRYEQAFWMLTGERAGGEAQ